MHGLINKAVQRFVVDTYDQQVWLAVTRRAGLASSEFEAMLPYEDRVTYDLIAAISEELDLAPKVVLEDIGTYLVTHPNLEPLRRLLRFCGVSFVAFLHSLDDVQARARLAVADLELPSIELHEHAYGRFCLRCRYPHSGFGYVLMGILRTMADDYGALVVLEHAHVSPFEETIRIQLVQEAHSPGREFELGIKSA